MKYKFLIAPAMVLTFYMYITGFFGGHTFYKDRVINNDGHILRTCWVHHWKCGDIVYTDFMYAHNCDSAYKIEDSIIKANF